MFWNDIEMNSYYLKLPKQLQKCLDIISKYCVTIRLEKSSDNSEFFFEGYDTPDCNGIEVFTYNSFHEYLTVTIWDTKNGWHCEHKTLKALEKIMRQNVENKKKYLIHKKLQKMNEDF